MGTVTIVNETTLHPVTLIGQMAGVCWGGKTEDEEKNFRRGLDCLKSEHGRTFEFPDVYMILDGYSARVIREFYTHIGGAPTRLQASTRYIDYNEFDMVLPPSIAKNELAKAVYIDMHKQIINALRTLESLEIPKEDSAMLLPLGMTTKVVCKMNLRTLMDMSRQRKCNRAYWEFRNLFQDLEDALREYSDEWGQIVDNYFKAKCDRYGFCPEKNSCGKHKAK